MKNKIHRTMGMKVEFNDIPLSACDKVHADIYVTIINNTNWSKLDAIQKIVTYKKEVKNNNIFIYYKGRRFFDYNNIIKPYVRQLNIEDLKETCEKEDKCKSILHFHGGNSGVTLNMGHLFGTKPKESELERNSQFDVYIKK